MKKYLILISIAVVTLGGFLVHQYFTFHDGRLHIVFCSVGQGDAVLIRTPGQKYVLYDSGPDKSVLTCLSRHMPLWKRTIDLAILSHPHTDHFLGYYYITERYSIKTFATEKLDNPTPGFQMLMEQLKKHRIPLHYVLQGDSWDLGTDVSLAVAGPSQNYLDRTSPGGRIGESKEFASVVLQVSMGSFRTLLTGDSQTFGLEDALDHIETPVRVLQSPHHGSATGLSEKLLEILAPELAVISVGKNNYGHPALATLYLLRDIVIKRTDKAGDVEIVSDGDNWVTLGK